MNSPEIEIMTVVISLHEDSQYYQSVYFLDTLVDAPKEAKLQILETLIFQAQALHKAVEESDTGQVPIIDGSVINATIH